MLGTPDAAAAAPIAEAKACGFFRGRRYCANEGGEEKYFGNGRLRDISLVKEGTGPLLLLPVYQNRLGASRQVI